MSKEGTSQQRTSIPLKEVIEAYGEQLSYDQVMDILSQFSEQDQYEIMQAVNMKQKEFWDSHEVVYYYSQIYPESPIVPHHLSQIVGHLAIEEGDTIVDLGCGPGILIKEIFNLYEDYGISVVGIDFSQSALEEASRLNKDHITSGRLKLLNQNLRQELSLPEGSVDKIVSNFGIVYSTKDEIQNTILEIRRVLKHNGRLVCSAVVKGKTLSPMRPKVLRLLGFDLFRKMRHIRAGLRIQKQLHHLFPMYPLSDLCSMIEDGGLAVVSTEPALIGMSVILVAEKDRRI